jgi:hypothetical protein
MEAVMLAASTPLHLHIDWVTSVGAEHVPNVMLPAAFEYWVSFSQSALSHTAVAVATRQAERRRKRVMLSDLSG